MTNRGTVIRANAGYAEVRFERMSACAGCHNAGSCEGLCESKPHTAKVSDPIGVRVGDTVDVETSSASVLRDAALVFALPALCAVILCGAVYLLSLPSFAYYIAAAAGIAIPFIAIKLTAEKRAEKSPSAVITAVIHDAYDNSDAEK